MNGIIKKLTDKGFGFIGVEGKEKDVFFHMKSLVGIQFDELREGDKVSFEIEDGQKGPAAVDVKLLEEDVMGAANDNATAETTEDVDLAA